MSQTETIQTPEDYVNYTFNIEARGVAEVSSDLVGLSNTVGNILGQIAFKTSEFLSHTDMLAIGTGAAISAMFVSASQDAIHFQQQIANVKAIGGESLNAEAIGEAAMNFSNKFGMATASMTEGLEALARAGITTTRVMQGVLEEGVKLSKLEGMDLEDSVNDLIATTNLLASDDVNMNDTQYAEMVKQMNQHIVSTSESAPINAQNIIQSLQHVGGYASASGMDQDDLFAVIAQLGARGTKGEMAGTALRAFIAAGQKDTAQRALARIGLNVTDLWNDNGETMLSISEMKDVLDQAMEQRGYSKQEKLEFYSDFAGYKQANQIMKIDTSEVQQYKEQIANAWDLGKKLDTILGTVRGNLDRIWQITQNFMTKVGSKLLTVAGALLAPVRALLEIFTSLPFADTAVAAGMIFVAFRTGLLIFNKLVPSIIGFMSGVTNVSKESAKLRNIWQDTNTELQNAKEIFGMIREGNKEGLVHKAFDEHELIGRHQEELEDMVAGQHYMNSPLYEQYNRTAWDNLPSFQRYLIKLNLKGNDDFRDNYKRTLEAAKSDAQVVGQSSLDLSSETDKEGLEAVNVWLKNIYNLLKSERTRGEDDSPLSNRESNRQANYISEIMSRYNITPVKYGNYDFKYEDEVDISKLKEATNATIKKIEKQVKAFDNADFSKIETAQRELYRKQLFKSDAENQARKDYSLDSHESEVRFALEHGRVTDSSKWYSATYREQIAQMANALHISNVRVQEATASELDDLVADISNKVKALDNSKEKINEIANLTRQSWDTHLDTTNFNFVRKNQGMAQDIAHALSIDTSQYENVGDAVINFFSQGRNQTNANIDKAIEIMFGYSHTGDGMGSLEQDSLHFTIDKLQRERNTFQAFINNNMFNESRDEMSRIIEQLDSNNVLFKKGGAKLGQALVKGFIQDGMGIQSPGYAARAADTEGERIINVIADKIGLAQNAGFALGDALGTSIIDGISTTKVFDSGIKLIDYDSDNIQNILSNFDPYDYYEQAYDDRFPDEFDMTNYYEQASHQGNINSSSDAIAIYDYAQAYGFDMSNFQRFGAVLGQDNFPEFLTPGYFLENDIEFMWDIGDQLEALAEEINEPIDIDELLDFENKFDENKARFGDFNEMDFWVDWNGWGDTIEEYAISAYYRHLEYISGIINERIKNNTVYDGVPIYRSGRLPIDYEAGVGEFFGAAATSFTPKMLESYDEPDRWKMRIFTPADVKGLGISTPYTENYLNVLGSNAKLLFDNQQEVVMGSGQALIRYDEPLGEEDFPVDADVNLLALTPQEMIDIRKTVIDEVSDMVVSGRSKSDILSQTGLDAVNGITKFYSQGENSVSDYEEMKRKFLEFEQLYYTDLNYVGKPYHTEDRMFDLFQTNWGQIGHQKYTDGPLGYSHNGKTFINPGAIKYHTDMYPEKYGSDYGVALLENTIHELTHVLADHELRSSDEYKSMYEGGIDNFKTTQLYHGYNTNFVAEFEANYVAVKTLEKLGLEASEIAKQRMVTFKKLIDDRNLENSYNLELLDSLVEGFVNNKAMLNVNGIATQFDMASAGTNKAEVANSLRTAKMAINNRTRSAVAYNGKSIESSRDADKLISDIAIDILSLNPATYGVDDDEDLLKQAIIGKYAPVVGMKDAKLGYEYASEHATLQAIRDYRNILKEDFNKDDYIKPELNPDYIPSSSDEFDYQWRNRQVKKYKTELKQSDYQDNFLPGTQDEITAYNQLIHSKSTLMKDYLDRGYNAYEVAYTSSGYDKYGYAEDRAIYIKDAVIDLDNLFSHSPGAYTDQLMFHGGVLNTNLFGFGKFNLRSLTYDEQTAEDFAQKPGRYKQQVYVPSGTQIMTPTHDMLGNSWYDYEHEATVGLNQPYFELSKRDTYTNGRKGDADILLLGPMQQNDFLSGIGLEPLFSKGEGGTQSTLDAFYTPKPGVFPGRMNQIIQDMKEKQASREEIRQATEMTTGPKFVMTPNIREFIENDNDFRNAIPKVTSIPKSVQDFVDNKRREEEIKRVQEQQNNRKRLIFTREEALNIRIGLENARERRNQLKELQEEQQQLYQEERKNIEEQKTQQAAKYDKERQAEKERLQQKWNAKDNKKIESEPITWDRIREGLLSGTKSHYYYFGGEKKIADEQGQSSLAKKMQIWGLSAIDRAEALTNQGKTKLTKSAGAVNEKVWQYAREQSGEGIGWGIENIENVTGAVSDFRNVLSGLSEVFPQLIPAVMALDYALMLQEYVTKGLEFASKVLTAARGEESIATLFEVEAAQGNILAKMMMTAANWAESESTWQRVAGTVALTIADGFAIAAEAILTFLRSIGAAGILAIAAAILVVIAAIEAVKFWENKHAEALKESQKALEEATAKNNVALSQYKDLKKARESETNAIRKQQAARKEAIALYELEAARINRRTAIHEEAKLRNDGIWGEYGLRASLQKMGLGFIAGGDFESQYEKYDGTTANIRQVKEASLGNLFASQEQRYVSSVYDNNSMFFAEVEAYQDSLGELYDKESKLIDQYGSIDAARDTKEFREAVQEFADATGLNGETAGKMLDWLETENRVNQATQAMKAQTRVIVAKADAKAVAADFDEESGLGDMDTLQHAMIMSQAQDIYQDAYDYMWWEKFQADLFGILWTIVDHLMVWDWTDHAEKYWKKSEAYQEGMEELSQLGVRGLTDIGDEMANGANRRDYGTGAIGQYHDTPFGGALESQDAMMADYAELIELERRYANEETQKFHKDIRDGMNKAGEGGVEGFKEGLDQHSPGAISRSIDDEMIYTQQSIQKNSEGVYVGLNTLGQGSVDSFKEGLGQDPEGNISKSTNEEMLYTQQVFEKNKEPIGKASYEVGYEAGEQYGKGFVDGLEALYAQVSTPEALAKTLEDRILVRQGYGIPEGADPNDPEVQRIQEERRAETESKLLARSGIGTAIFGVGKKEGKAAYKVATKEGANWQNASVIGRIVNSAEIAANDGLGAGIKALFAPKYKDARRVVDDVPTGKIAGTVDDALKGLGKRGSRALERVGIDTSVDLGAKATGWVARNFGDDAAKLAVKGSSKLAKAVPFVGTGITAAMSIAEHNPFEKHYNEDGSEKRAFQSTGEVAGEIAGAFASDVIGAEFGPVAGMVAGLVLEPIGEAVGGTIGWMADEVVNTKFTDAWGGFNDALGGIPNQIVDFIDQSPIGQAGHAVWDGLNSLTGGWLGDTWENIKNSSIAELTGLDQLGGALQGLGEWLFGGGEENQEMPTPDQITDDQIMQLERAGMLDEYLAKYGLDKEQKNVFNDKQAQKTPIKQNGNTVIIKNININTEDDPEKIKSALMNLIIEMQEQISPRQVSRTVGEPPATQSTSDTQNTNNTPQTEGTDAQSGTPNGNQTTTTNNNPNPT